MIFVTHGVAPQWRADRISHGLLISETRIAEYLQRRESKFVPLTKAILGIGDALTVDDATYGALRVVLLARMYGHAVTWFINGFNVEHGRGYFPFQFSFMLDETVKDECHLFGQKWNLRHAIHRRNLRLHLKQTYLQMSCQQQIDELVQKVSSALDVDPSQIEKCLNTVGPADLAMAAASGVELRNHGWSHLNPQMISTRQLEEELKLNEEYLSYFRQSPVMMFAPPFGHQVNLSTGVVDYMLLADRRLLFNQVSASVMNRCELADLEFPTLVERAPETHIPVNEMRWSL